VRNQLITVFGGAGFIGRHLVRRLAGQGARVVVVSRNPARGYFLQPRGGVGQILVVRVDLASEQALARALDGTSAVVNLMGILYETRQQKFEDVHAVLPGRIAKVAAVAGIGRMVHVSAIGADPASTSAYARSKADGEKRAHEGLPGATILRPSIVIGPEDGFFNRFAAMARLSPVLPLIGGGETRFQPVYVGDVADAVLAALRMPEAAGQTYQLGGPRVYSFAELMRYMLEVLGRRRILAPLSFGLASFQARFLELLPVPPLTRDQVELLKVDNVVADGAKGLADLGIAATPIELVVPEYLARYRATPVRLAGL
jgi:NADH dehydrogenase